MFGVMSFENNIVAVFEAVGRIIVGIGIFL